MKLSRMDHLTPALELVEAALYQAPVTLAWSAAEDPLAIGLPPLGPNGAEFQVSPGTLRVMAGLYLQAELEQTGLIAVAEMLSDERTNLVIRSPEAAARLEAFYRHRQGWYDRQTRERLFARLYGIGPAVNAESGNAINRDFRRCLGVLCLAVNHVEEDYRFGQSLTSTEERLRWSAIELLNNLGPRQYGNALLAAQQIQEELREAIALLSEPGILGLFGAQGLWDLLQRILGPQAPEFHRLVELGQNGLRLLNWLASVIPQLKDQASHALLAPGSPVFMWASAWLVAFGIKPRSAGDMRPSQTQGILSYRQAY